MIDVNRTRIGEVYILRTLSAESVQLDDVGGVKKGLEQGPGIALVIPTMKESLLRAFAVSMTHDSPVFLTQISL